MNQHKYAGFGHRTNTNTGLLALEPPRLSKVSFSEMGKSDSGFECTNTGLVALEPPHLYQHRFAPWDPESHFPLSKKVTLPFVCTNTGLLARIHNTCTNTALLALQPPHYTSTGFASPEATAPVPSEVC